MANAKLHMICGNCGSNDQFTYEITQEVNEAGLSTYDVAKEPDNKLIVTIDGTDYYIALYTV